MRLSAAAEIVGGKLTGRDDIFRGVVIDARECQAADLFVALPGRRRDGHEFIAQAAHRGAAAALVSRAPSDTKAACLARVAVPDTTAALAQIGAHWRGRFNIPVAAVTGSCGKTTVSNLIASILNQTGNCLMPRGSFNNHWGVPLTLLRLRAAHTHAVLELGMNRRGEIAALSELVKPAVALINNAAPAHLAGLGNLRGIAAAKAEIMRGLDAAGTAVLNRDDAFYDYWARHAAAHTTLSFGLNATAQTCADIRATDIAVDAAGSSFKLHIRKQCVRVRLPLLGRHNIRNALAASAVTHALGAPPARIAAGLAAAAAIPGRLRRGRGLNRARLLDDSYNANPSSCRAALDALAEFDGRRIAVFGAMAELGARSAELHREVGAHARHAGLDKLIIFGAAKDADLAAYAQGFGAPTPRFHQLADLIAMLSPLLAEDVTVLIKGSRAAGMERVVAALQTDRGERC